jgi:hypothetical protein
MLSEKESKKFKGFMDLVKRNVPDMSRIIDIMPLHQKLIDKKNEMNNELNNSSMTQSQKTTYENYIGVLNDMINLTEARINELNNSGGGRRRKMSRKRKSIKKRKSSRRKRLSRRRYI